MLVVLYEVHFGVVGILIDITDFTLIAVQRLLLYSIEQVKSYSDA